MNVLELSEQEIVRRNNLNELRALGIDPYPADEYPTDAFSTDIKAEYNDAAEETPSVHRGPYHEPTHHGQSLFPRIAGLQRAHSGVRHPR